MAEPNKKIVLSQELQRLKAKKAAVDDRDIKQALQLRIDALETELAEVEKAPAVPEPVENEAETANLVPPTPEQIRKADDLIRQARVEKIRKNNTRALALMKEAAEVAPNAPTVLEALGDDYLERKYFKEAQNAYGKALKYAKNNVELERKYGTTVLRAKGMSIYDSATKLDSSDPLFLTPGDTLARVGPARLLSAFIPGVGNLVLGNPPTGLALIASTVVWIVWIAVMGKDLNGLFHMMFGHVNQPQPNLLILVPIFGFVVTWMIGQASIGGAAPSPKIRHSRPGPAVNLPFE